MTTGIKVSRQAFDIAVSGLPPAQRERLKQLPDYDTSSELMTFADVVTLIDQALHTHPSLTHDAYKEAMKRYPDDKGLVFFAGAMRLFTAEVTPEVHKWADGVIQNYEQRSEFGLRTSGVDSNTPKTWWQRIINRLKSW